MKRKINTKIRNLDKKTVAACIDNYVNEFAEDMEFAAQDTIHYNSMPLYNFFGDCTIKNLPNKFTVRKYKKWRNKNRAKKIAQNTINRELTLLKACLNLAVGKHKLDKDGDYKIIKDKSDFKVLDKFNFTVPRIESRTGEYIPSVEDAEEIIKHLPDHLKIPAQAAIMLGYRKSELFGLRFSMINFKKKYIQLPPSLRKGEKKLGYNSKPLRTVLYPEIYQLLKDQYKEAQKVFERDNVNNVFVFRGRDKKTPIKGNNTFYYWERACQSAYQTENGKHKFNWHDLRKTAIKYLRFEQNFQDREMIRKMFTGHKNKEIFDRIYDVVTSEDELHWFEIGLSKFDTLDN